MLRITDGYHLVISTPLPSVTFPTSEAVVSTLATLNVNEMTECEAWRCRHRRDAKGWACAVRSLVPRASSDTMKPFSFKNIG